MLCRRKYAILKGVEKLIQKPAVGKYDGQDTIRSRSFSKGVLKKDNGVNIFLIRHFFNNEFHFLCSVQS